MLLQINEPLEIVWYDKDGVKIASCKPDSNKFKKVFVLNKILLKTYNHLKLKILFAGISIKKMVRS